MTSNRYRMRDLRVALSDRQKSTAWLVDHGYSIKEVRKVGGKHFAIRRPGDDRLWYVHAIPPSEEAMGVMGVAVRRRWKRFLNTAKEVS